MYQLLVVGRGCVGMDGMHTSIGAGGSDALAITNGRPPPHPHQPRPKARPLTLSTSSFSFTSHTSLAPSTAIGRW